MIATACHQTVYGTPYRRHRSTLRYVITWPLVLTIDAILWCLGGQTWRSLRGEGAWWNAAGERIGGQKESDNG